MKKVFIDGRAGTTGLRIYQRLEGRRDIDFLSLTEEERKDPVCRAEMLNRADVVFLCLPDEAAVEAADMVSNPATVLIDTSTAHRTSSGWVYGFPELSDSIRDSIPTARRIAVPGCHASGFIALVRPLVESGLLSPDSRLSCHSVTGYSGGGKKMISQYQAEGRSALLDAPRQYGLTQTHKHLREMKALTGLSREPVFCPIVSDFYSGMVVTVPLFADDLIGGAGPEDIRALYRQTYQGPIVHYTDGGGDGDGFLSAAALSGRDDMEIAVFGSQERILLTARYDNLGKGASGAAVEILNLLLGADPATGLNV